jgi:hypothetical protein
MTMTIFHQAHTTTEAPMMVDNTHYQDAHTLRQEMKQLYGLAIATFSDRAFAECMLFCRYLGDEMTFDQNKRLVEKQIGRKVKLTAPLAGHRFIGAWKEFARFMPPPKRSTPNAIVVRRH